MTFTQKTSLALFVSAVLFCLALIIGTTTNTAYGSTPDGASDYLATSTAANNSAGAFTTSRTLKAGFGSFGSYIITGANTGTVNFYNATTSDVNKRTGQKATSTILIASFPASTAAGTYVFDAAFTDGLYLEITGSAPTSTVTYR